VPYEIVSLSASADMRRAAELRAVHPLGSRLSLPKWFHHRGVGRDAEYLIDNLWRGRLYRAETPERCATANGCIVRKDRRWPPLLLKLFFTLMPKRAPALAAARWCAGCNQALTTLVIRS